MTSAHTESDVLGLIAGGGDLPRRLLDACRAQSRPVFVLALQGFAAEDLLQEGIPGAWIRLGEAGQGVRLLKDAGVRDLVMAGGVRRPSLQDLRPDWWTTRFLGKVGLKALGDDGILRAISAALEDEGFRMIGAQEVLRSLLAPAGQWGVRAADAQALADIDRGRAVVAGLGALDVGQAAVVQAGLVLGVEAIEGTDALIARCADLRRDGPGGVLVKMAKPGQDRRLDLPTIGVETVRRCAAAGLRGIAVSAGATLVLDQAAVVAAADDAGLFVLGFDPGAPEAAAGAESLTPGAVGRDADTAPLIYLIAGEPSGDLLAARLMAALKQLTGGQIRFAGIGGEAMRAEGMPSLFPQADLAVMGLAEVLPRIPRILRRQKETLADIAARQPDLILTIDSWGFTGRIAKALKAGGAAIPRVHYVAPMVWAWKEKRVHQLAARVDLLLCLLPQEPEMFRRAGLESLFVGHSVLDSGADRGDGAAFRARSGLAENVPLLAVLPGSRSSETSRLLPVFGETVRRLQEKIPGLQLVVPTVETVAAQVRAETARWPLPVHVVTGTAARYDAFAACTAALAASGTVSLELALAGVPMVIGYKVAALTGFLARRLLKIRYVSLLNLVQNQPVIPELLQENCTAGQLEAALLPLLTDPAAAQRQRDGLNRGLALLRAGPDHPGEAAARAVLARVPGAGRGEGRH